MPRTIEVLYFADCPNYQPALTLLLEVMRAERVTLPVTLIAVESEETARALDFRGSPTIRIDGADAVPSLAGSTPSLACRVYRDSDGRLSPVPPRDAIVAALRGGAGER
jgi:hypothetical protein